MGFTRDIPTPLNIPNTVPKRDPNSEFSVTKIHGNLDGNASTADDGISSVIATGGLTLVLSNKVITGSIDSSAISSGLAVQNSGSAVGTESSLNLIAGSNVSLGVVDDTANHRINVTVSATGTVNSANNIGTGSVAVYKQTSGGVLQFRKLSAASSKVNVSLNVDEVDVDVVPGNISHDTLGGTGTFSHPQIDLILADLSPQDALSMDTLALPIYSGTTTKYTGYLTSGATVYKGGDGAGANVNYIINDATFNLQTPSISTGINKGEQGLLRLYVNGTQVDTFDLAASFDVSLKNTNQTYPPATSSGGKITIQSVGKYNSFRAYQKLNALMNITPSMLVDGYNSIYLVHDISGTLQTSATFDLFYDTDSGANPSVSIPTLTGLSQTSSKYLSGIRFVSTNDTITLGVVGSNLFNNVYHNQPIVYNSLAGVIDNVIVVTDGSVTGLSIPPARLQTMTVTAKTLTFASSNVCSNNARITTYPRDPYGSYSSTTSASQNLLVSMFGTSNSNNGNEYFRDEAYRLPLSFDSSSTSATITGQWTSSTALSNGNAQFYFSGTTVHGLVYPTIDFTSGYVPAQTSRNYSVFSGTQRYLRAFLPTSNKTSITFALNGVSAGISTLGTGDVNIEVKLPTQTGWLDAAVAYSSGLGVGSDGLGCLSGSISYSGGNAALTATFGGKTTGDSGGRMYIRISLRNTNRTISSITTNW